MIAGIILALICTAIMIYFTGSFIENWREIEREEMERQTKARCGKEADYWREQALRARTEIKVIGGESFSLENRR